MDVLGIDIGGTGIKGAPVDTGKGILTTDRLRIATPHPAEPHAVADVVAEIVTNFQWKGPVGVTFPGVIKDGVVLTAANVSKQWVGTDAAELFGGRVGTKVSMCNDADAAGIAEMRFGAGRDEPGVVLMVTLGTGIGTALFMDGVLIPNTELGHLRLPDGKEAEHRASELVREEHDLSWEKWAKRLSEYFQELEKLLSPRLFIVGGGVSRKHEKFLPLVEGVQAPIRPAEGHNDAGIIGAGLWGGGQGA